MKFTVWGQERKEVQHPDDFHVSGPRNFSSPSWRELISSSWKDENYRRTVIACFIQSVYLLEVDRQERRTKETALAPKWCKSFKYKLVQTLVDERDGSIFGAVLEWDRLAALGDFLLLRPTGAPRAVLALRGTLLNFPTIRRDLEDDLRFAMLENLKGSVRFNASLEAVKLMVNRYGSCNVCIAGHSLGAGFALQVGKELAEKGVSVETHLFNPPSVSLVMFLRRIFEEIAEFLWQKFKSTLPSISESLTKRNKSKKMTSNQESNKWVPHLYVNNSDYICCYYSDDRSEKSNSNIINSPSSSSSGKENDDTDPAHGQAESKLFVQSKGKQWFLEAHKLDQWWSNDLELELFTNNSKLITHQLKSLYSLQKSSSAPPTVGKPQRQLSIPYFRKSNSSNI